MFSRLFRRPPASPDGLESAPQAATIADLRRHTAYAPGGVRFDHILKAFLPLVYGTASRLFPENSASAERVVVAVFQTFGYRWRRLKKRTLIGTWLLQTTRYAAERERKAAGLPKVDANSPAQAHWTTLKEWNRLPVNQRDAVLLRSVVQEDEGTVARALRVKPLKVEKLTNQGTQALAKRLRKKRVDLEPASLLQSFKAAVPHDLENVVLSGLAAWSPKQNKSDLVRAVLRSWNWVVFRRGVRRMAQGFATVICVLAILFSTFIWLAHNGYLNEFFQEQNRRQMARETPELLEPSRPWPSTPADEALVSRQLPKTSAELYALTNIWTAKLSFTPEQWKGITPSRVETIGNIHKNGRINLLNPKAKRNGLAGAVGYDFNWTEGRLEFAGQEFPRVAVRYRGNGTFLNSLYGPKQSLKVDLNEFTKGQKIGGVKTLNFLNSIADFSYVRDVLAEQLFRDLGVPGPRTAYAYVTVDVPGKYTNQAFGLFVLMENIDEDYAKDRFGTKSVPIFKPVTYDLFKDLGNDWSAYQRIYDLKTKAEPEEKQRVIEFARLVTHASDEEFARRFAEFVDIEVYAAFVAGHVLLASYDGYLTNGQNYYMYLDPRSNKFGFISWDQDHSWGEFGYVGSPDQRAEASIWKPAAYNNRFLERAMKVEAFRTAYRRILEKALDELFTVERLYAQVDRLVPIIRPAIEAENKFRLEKFDISVSTNSVTGHRHGPPEGPRAPVHQIKRFIPKRIESVRAQLDGKSDGALLSRH